MSCPGDIVLDCFAGSGTTLVAAEELNRQWIGVDIGEEAIKTIINRFKFGTNRMGDYVTPKQPSLFTETDGDAARKPITFDIFRTV